MATISVTAFSLLHPIPTLTHSHSHFPSPTLSFRSLSKRLSSLSKTRSRRPTFLRSAEEETLVEPVPEEAEQPVSVPVSPSDTLTMFFQADGTLSDAAVPAVTKALEGTEGVSNLKVEVHEGIGIVELKKQTTVQATGVASSLVEAIQSSGFKLQTLNLSFEEEEEIAV
ncbi:uncharacterized protein LOC126797439 [Argentina anserina]|uniref:uncharacterized protein LOC126797439 n=1 Tax=Argentina anserina TaxID=57926 RepID=UPI00217665AA|nr:uncharacterized protein LOC126797439 [Potentilla anserina]